MSNFNLVYNRKGGGSYLIDYKGYKIQFKMVSGMSIKWFKQVDGVWYKCLERNYMFLDLHKTAVPRAINMVDNLEDKLIAGLEKQIEIKKAKAFKLIN